MGKALVGILIGLLLAEGAFWLRDGGAFSHLNIYEADADLGVRLRPHADMRLVFGGNPATQVRTNARGLRGAMQGDALVVGDSQVFGLGVEEHETFAALLGAVNAGVPTYGPQEYTAMVERLLPVLKAKTVIYVVNLANDLFELERPNIERHAVWDGWAVRKETAPTSILRFPGRDWLMSRSHLVYAVRRLLHRVSEDTALPSEGGWQDVAAQKPGSLPVALAGTREKLDARTEIARQLGRVNAQITSQFTSHVFKEPAYQVAAKQLAHYAGDARDIVANPYAEAARPIDTTANELLRAALGMEKNVALLRRLATEQGNKPLVDLLDQRAALRAKLAALDVHGSGGGDSPLAAVLQRTLATCVENGAQLVVVALPLDVQVSADEWAKYGRKPQDMGPTQALAEWVTQSAERLGAKALDALPVLHQAEPGAFLRADLHMSARGHQALAAALRTKIAEAPPRRELSLPTGRSWPPTADEWAAEAEITVKGSSAARCETKRIREWFRARCFAERRGPFPDDGENEPLLGARAPLVALVQGGHGDAFASVQEHFTTFITPVLGDETIVARFTWEEHAQRLVLSNSSMAFGPKEPAKRDKAPVQPPSIRAEGIHDGACLSANKPHEACALDVPTRDPLCRDGELAFGATRRCVPRCGADRKCVEGRCEEWMGSAGCVRP